MSHFSVFSFFTTN
jgi:hypothetical protein